ncbi:MAG: S-layer homology domain-containing protein [Deltaproteobacteria bacterium]|nr:S-layer homology domain-containing protein [Deltaproteobacteria bacterium]
MKKIRILVMLAAVAALAGCATPAARCTSPEDNPRHHYLRGMEALESLKVDQAMGKFDRAVYCEEQFSAAWSGRAIAHAVKARTQNDAGFKGVEVERALEDLEKGRKLAETDNDRFENQVAAIRVNDLIKGGKWLEGAENAFREAMNQKVDERLLDYYQGKEAASYFMGLAYLDGYEFRKAEDKFRDTLGARKDGKWNEPADRAWKKTNKIVRAMGGVTVGDVGKKIAVKEGVGRGDLAALLIDEMKLDKLFAGRIPVRSQVDRMQAEFTPADVMNHPFKDEVLIIMKWKVRGLEPKFDETTKAYLFKVEDRVARGEMAFILEDVLIKLTGDEKLATAFFGQDRSPFPDVKPTSPFYNAVLNMTTRGIMEGELSGEFRVSDPVDGAEAILAVRMLQQRINIH